GPRVHELAVELGHLLRVLEDDLGDERPRLHVAAPLELEEVGLGAYHRAQVEAFEQSGSVSHAGPPASWVLRGRGGTRARPPGPGSRGRRRRGGKSRDATPA